MGALKPGLALVVALAFLLGCGGDDQETSANPASEQRQAQAQAKAEVKANNAKVLKEYKERNAAEAPSTEETQAKQSAERFYEVLATDKAKGPNATAIDSASFCELMSEEAKEQTVHYAQASSGIQKEWDCEAAVELLVVRSKRLGGFKQAKAAKVIGVNAEGDRATATIRFGSGVATSVPLVREEGEWKLAGSPVESGE